MSPDPAPSDLPQEPRGRSAADVARGHVLVVEADRDLREGTADLLRLEGYGVVDVETGLDALLHLFTGEPLPDVVVFDEDGPGMSCAEFQALVRRHAEAAAVPLLVLTSRPAEAPAARATFLKPCRPEALVAAVAAASRHRLS